MPYVPRDDRPAIDAAVESAAVNLCLNITGNFSVLSNYKNLFLEVGSHLCSLAAGSSPPIYSHLAQVIFDVGARHGYDGAFLGELNYAITRLIQRVPQIMIAKGYWQAKDELRYWLYAVTVEALVYASNNFIGNPWTQDVPRGFGVGGVFEDIKDEYKRRVNTSYEAAQIVKSGDCYDTPYYNRLMRIVDRNGNEIAKFLVDVPRSEATLNVDVLEATLTAY